MRLVPPPTPLLSPALSRAVADQAKSIKGYLYLLRAFARETRESERAFRADEIHGLSLDIEESLNQLAMDLGISHLVLES